MIHVPALPGTPAHKLNTAQIIKQVVKEAKIYAKAGVDALMIENMHDTPYLKNQVGPEIVAMMAILAQEIKNAVQLPLGIQVLAAANQAALAVAKAASLDFIRAEGFVFGHVADEGYIDANAGKLLRYRKLIGAEHIAIFTDLKKKHSAHAVTADVDIVETAKAAEFFRSDGLIITGSATGHAADLAELKAVAQNTKLPVLVGSGVNLQNVAAYLAICDGLIIGSYFKEKSYWENPINPTKVSTFMKKVRKLR